MCRRFTCLYKRSGRKVTHIFLAEELKTSCEIIWIKIEMVKVKSLYVRVFYRPPTSSALLVTKTFEELETSIARIQNSNANIWLC